MRTIICCSCGNVPTSSQVTYWVKYKEEAPKPYVGKQGYTLLKSLPEGSEVHKFVQSVLKKKGRYAYYVEWDASGTLQDCMNLLTGRKLA